MVLNSRLLLFSSCVALVFHCVFGVYEDQAGSTDWLKQNVGDIRFAAFASRHVYVGTGASVVASLGSRTGNIQWRRVLPADEGPVVGLFLQKRTLVSLSDGGKQIRLCAAVNDDFAVADVLCCADGKRPMVHLYGMLCLFLMRKNHVIPKSDQQVVLI